MLATSVHGADKPGPPLLIAHGLFGSARNWGVLAGRLSPGRPVIAVDMRNHGQSPRMAPHTYAAMAEDLAEVIAAHGGMADLLGHSMGGKAAMVLALTRPGLLRRLIVADIAPVAYGHTQAGLVAAMQALDPAAHASRAEADAALAPSVPDATTRAFLLQSLELRPEPRWLLQLDLLGLHMPDILGFPEPGGGSGARFEGPALFLRGALSDYVRPEHEARIMALFPQARIETIPDAGHWLHAEQPRAVEEAVARFLG